MLRKIFLSVGMAAALCAAPSLAAAQSGETNSNMRKIGGALNVVYKKNQAAVTLRSAQRAAPVVKSRPDWSGEGAELGLARAGGQELMVAKVSSDGYVRLDAIASGAVEDLSATMEAMGARNVASAGKTVSASFPVDRLDDLAASNYLAFARPVIATTNVGLVTSQGDRSMRTDIVRQEYGYDGSGLTIGVLSDSYACDPGPLNAAGVYTTPAEDEANNDVPPNVGILADLPVGDPDCIDEGRGMAQLIHDVAPEAKILFHTAFGGEADFASGIVELALAGADVIVDDVIYFTEPMFQDGIIAQAADEVARLGVPYYSSNGNRARDAFQTEYRPVAFDGSTFHDFDEGPGVDPLMTVQLDGSLQTNLTFQWDSPNLSASGTVGAPNDVDVIMFDDMGNRVPDCFEFLDANGFFPDLCQFQFTDGGVPIDGGAGGDAIELVSLVDFIGGSTVNLGFETQSGDAPGLVKFVIFGGGFASSEYEINDPSGFGHNNAAGAEGVGAAAFYFTEEFIGDPSTLQLRALAGEPECVPACLNDFSSAGGTPILFDTDGDRLRRPEVRLKPGLTGPDGTNTTFFTNDTSRDDDDGDGVFATGEPGEFPNFFGTSAAAPHAAAVAALMIDSENSQIVRTAHNGAVSFRMCMPREKRGRGHRWWFHKKDPRPDRIRGRDLRVSPDEVADLVDEGALLGPCDRSEPENIYWVMRATAQDMSVRASNGTGETIQVFDELGPRGFDFDSGFGFIDAKEAIKKFDRGRGRHYGWGNGWGSHRR
ncbi:hypothetical protein [Hyphococcus sp.]|uniref:hypothetical protein n=1 Tax=Hyphococcus sp. TaxID=2038636 RepID=UPI003D1295ED